MSFPPTTTWTPLSESLPCPSSPPVFPDTSRGCRGIPPISSRTDLVGRDCGWEGLRAGEGGYRGSLTDISAASHPRAPPPHGL